MQRFKLSFQAQRFVSAHGMIYGHFPSTSTSDDCRAQAAPTVNPMDDMRAHKRMMQARMDAMQEIMPTAEQLYNAMSPKQKGMWDDVVISYKVGGCHLLCRAGLE